MRLRVSLLLGIPFLASLLSSCDRAPGPETVREWERALRDIKGGNLDDRRKAARTIENLSCTYSRILGNKPDCAPIEVLVKTACDRKEDREIRTTLVHAFSMPGLKPCATSESTVTALLVVLDDETEDEQVRAWVAMVLPQFGHQDRITEGILRAIKSRNTMVRVNAAEALPSLNLSADRLVPVISFMMKGEPAQVRAVAVAEARRLAKTEPRLLSVIAQGLDDKDQMVRYLSRQLLLSLEPGKNDDRELLQHLVDKGGVSQIYASAALFGMTTKMAPYGELIRESLKSSDFEKKRAAVIALFSLGAKAAAFTPELRALVNDQDSQTRLYAMADLVNVTGNLDEWCVPLTKGIGVDDQVGRAFSLGFLIENTERAGPETVRAIVRATNEKDGFVRAMAVSLLGSLKMDIAEKRRILVEKLGDSSPEVRVSALLECGKLGESARPALEDIRARLRDEHLEVRVAAEHALAQITR
jgi:HEAT repeat protein